MVSLLPTSLPLCVPRDAVPGTFVSVQLDQPLTGDNVSERQERLSAFLSLATQAEIALEQELKVSGASLSKHRWQASGPAVSEMLFQLDELAQALNQEPAAAYLESSEMDALFPVLATRLTGQVPEHDDDFHIIDYLTQQTCHNQVIVLAHQLADDLSLPSHKYYAHQVALLYQSLNQAGSYLAPYKKQIEGKFDSIKSLTENSETPRLDDELQQWLRTFTRELLQYMQTWPDRMLRKIDTVGDYACAEAIPDEEYDQTKSKTK